MSTSFRVVDTALGQIAFVAGARGLRQVFLPQGSQAVQRRAVKRAFPDVVEDDELMPELAQALRRYAKGEPVDFDVRLDCRGAADFHVEVWHACRQVPYGRTVSYRELAARAGRPGAARAVGTAMRGNRFPLVVPCHRVLRSDGGLGGYSGPGGTAFKQRLLEMEQATTCPAP
jgi:methylated-DNA-[protein]-cysteine S-methyltransferase